MGYKDVWYTSMSREKKKTEISFDTAAKVWNIRGPFVQLIAWAAWLVIGFCLWLYGTGGKNMQQMQKVIGLEEDVNKYQLMDNQRHSDLQAIQRMQAESLKQQAQDIAVLKNESQSQLRMLDKIWEKVK